MPRLLGGCKTTHQWCLQLQRLVSGVRKKFLTPRHGNEGPERSGMPIVGVILSFLHSKALGVWGLEPECLGLTCLLAGYLG